MGESSVLPTECALVVGIPLEETAFLRNLARPHGYVASMAREAGWSRRAGSAAWRLYERRVAMPVSEVMAAVRAHGVDVRPNGTLDELAGCARARRVVTLFAHGELESGGGTVEFADDTVPIDEVAESLPDGFDGVVDLALCHSWALGEAVKSARPACLVVVHTRQVVPAFRALFYRRVVDVLSSGQHRYTDAILGLAKELLP